MTCNVLSGTLSPTESINQQTPGCADAWCRSKDCRWRWWRRLPSVTWWRRVTRDSLRHRHVIVDWSHGHARRHLWRLARRQLWRRQQSAITTLWSVAATNRLSRVNHREIICSTLFAALTSDVGYTAKLKCKSSLTKRHYYRNYKMQMRLQYLRNQLRTYKQEQEKVTILLLGPFIASELSHWNLSDVWQELIGRWDSESELLLSAPGSYPNSLK